MARPGCYMQQETLSSWPLLCVSFVTGPIERGDWDTVASHREAIRSVRPDLEPLYDVLAEATAR